MELTTWTKTKNRKTIYREDSVDFMQMILANQLIQFCDETSVDLMAEARLNRSVDRFMITSDHTPVAITSDSRVKCCIC